MVGIATPLDRYLSVFVRTNHCALMSLRVPLVQGGHLSGSQFMWRVQKHTACFPLSTKPTTFTQFFRFAFSCFACLTLPLLFFTVCHPWQEVPEPVNFFVTHWSKDMWSQMSYSFVKTGGSGEAYDILAEDVQGKVFFAGEVTLLLTYLFSSKVCFL